MSPQNLHAEPNPLSMAPFAALLLTVAAMPALLPLQWHRHHAKVCAGFAALTVSYYIFALHSRAPVLHAIWEYGSFVVVVGGFFITAGGIHLQVRGRATPAFNTAFLFAGAVLGSLLGTVGASMLLIRPWMAVNRPRFAAFHTVFFIIVVSNISGVLLPVGPPLLLGYVKGVPFWWVAQHSWLPWIATLLAVLGVFYVWDRLHYGGGDAEITAEKWRCAGGTNFLVMLAMLGCLILLSTGWRELFIALLAAAAYWITPPKIRQRNEFSFAPLKEIAWIFLGIFATMIPILEYVEKHAGDIGVHSDLQFYWATGALSALLDNAPAYLTVLAGALGLHGLRIEEAGQITEFLTRHDRSLVAISLGATCFGALTYIGNGPNLLVKAIVQHAGLKTPGFFGYIFRFALPVLLPIFALVSWLFFR
jgi:Na+/H+ antiporter NhaD/arsenite permease-like protein